MEKVGIFIHASTLSGVENRILQFLDSFNESGLYEIVEFIKIYVVGDNFKIKLNNPRYEKIESKITIEYLSDDLSVYEVYTQNKMWLFCKENTDYKILYLHTKNVGKELNICIEEQIEFNLYFLNTRWRECIEHLNTYATCSIELVEEPVLHYSAFWWTNAWHIASLPDPIVYGESQNPLNSKRHNQEFWICSKLNKETYFCMWNTGIKVHEKHITRLPREAYRQD